MSTDPAPASLVTAALEAKASTLRGMIKVLEARGLLGAVRAHVTAATRALLDAPPPASSWISHAAFEDLGLAVVAVAGTKAWREVTFTAGRDSVLPLLRVGIEGVLRLFGATPVVVFSRWQQLAASSVRGIHYEFRSTGPRSGEIVVTYEGCRNVPIAVFHATAGSLELGFDVTGHAGSVDEPEVLPGDGNRAVYRVRW